MAVAQVTVCAPGVAVALWRGRPWARLALSQAETAVLRAQIPMSPQGGNVAPTSTTGLDREATAGDSRGVGSMGRLGWWVVERSDWIELSERPLPLSDVVSWVILPGCGAVDLFCGTVRDHSEGRPGVERLEYEAYEGAAMQKLEEIAHEARSRWPDMGRLAMLHRTGILEVGEVSVVVAVSMPHRAESFGAAHWCIDTLKASVPIWKREIWAGGEDWGLCAHELTDVSDVSVLRQ